jgi:predicted ATPase
VRSLELRAAIARARHWQDRGRREPARALLAPVYGAFTEGLETADLRAAAALLDALA